MPQNLWNDTEYSALPDLEGLVYRSNLLGRDRAVVNIYGGNTSAKLEQIDFAGRETRVLYVKASGFDVLTIKAKDFAALRLADIQPLFQRNAMSDEQVTDYLAHTVFEPGRPRQSIETLLHSFVPFRHVDHTHPDAVLSLVCTPNGEATARRLFGNRMAWVDYIRPGFTLSKQIGQQVRDNPEIDCIVMGKHGLVTWGDDPKSCYESTIRTIQKAEDFVREQWAGKVVFGAVKVPALDKGARHDLVADVLPLVRGLVTTERGDILAYDETDEVLDYVARERTAEISQVGAACPDHMVHIKWQPLFVDWTPGEGPDTLKTRLKEGIADYKARYVEYFNANKSQGDELRDATPRVLLIPGLGMISTGRDATAADVARQLYHRAIAVIGGSEALGGYESLTVAEAYAVEYWPLEWYRLKLGTPHRDLAGQVALITYGASGVGRATAHRLAQEGAHVVVADGDAQGAQGVAADLVKRFGFGRGLAVRCDVTSEQAVAEAFRLAVMTYGGVDIVVNNAGIVDGKPIEETSLNEWRRHIDILATGYFLVAREGFRVLKKQGRGGTLVIVGSENSLGLGKAASACSATKAAERLLAHWLAEEGGEFGIRVNSVLLKGRLRSSSIWDSERHESSAPNDEIRPEEREALDQGRNAPAVAVSPDDVAETILFLAGPRSARTTGSVLTVDGSDETAYVR
jgi:rhamnulose-1-phosphate aldolase/alcohol dehydrogenase